jgi:putative hydrolase of the HAD superfamily
MGVGAVIFDWGGTLTPWCPPDERLWWRVAAQLVPVDRVDAVAAALVAADAQVWQRARLEHRSGTVAEMFAAAGLELTDRAYRIFAAAMEHTTVTDPQAPAMLRALRERGLKIGVLSNTTWSRDHHEQIFARDGVLDLIDGAVYTSEIDVTKPHPAAFRAAMAAVGESEPGRCVFVGDRLFDDIHGAGSAGMRTVLVPHSAIPEVQRGHTDGVPDAVIQQLADLPAVIDRWLADGPPRPGAGSAGPGAAGSGAPGSGAAGERDGGGRLSGGPTPAGGPDRAVGEGGQGGGPVGATQVG